MSASRNKSKSSGLRILWVPGRKKNHHKGRFESTGKHVDYSRGSREKPNEPWSLGGNKAQEKLIEADITSGAEGPSGLTGTIPPAVSLVSGSAINSVMKLPEEPNKFSILGEKDCNEIKGADSLEYIDDGDTIDAKAVLTTEKKESNLMKSKDKINSIEYDTPENNLNNKKKSNLDLTDSSLYLNKLDNGKKKTKNKKKKRKNTNRNDGDIEEDEDEKTVKCLYYTLMCCECTIS